MANQSNRSAQTVERALQHLRAKVISGELMPGEQIRQQEMADALGVSRVPLREALNLLADQGLLIHRPNSGYFVAKRDPNELAQIRRILQLLENELLASLEWPDRDCLQRLKELNDQMRECAVASDWTPIVRLNREFHLEIYSRSPFKLILQEVKRLWALADSFIATSLADMSARVRTVEEHDQIIASLAKREHDLVLATMEAHRTSTAKLFMRLPFPQPSPARAEPEETGSVAA